MLRDDINDDDDDDVGTARSSTIKGECCDDVLCVYVYDPSRRSCWCW